MRQAPRKGPRRRRKFAAPVTKRVRTAEEPSNARATLEAEFREAFGVREDRRLGVPLAGLERDALHKRTLTHVSSNFRLCRDSGVTWLAMSGLAVDKIMRRAGHNTYDTTMGYVKLAEDLSRSLGAPLGPLPASLRGNRTGPGTRPSNESGGKKAARSVPEEGVEPPT